MRLIQLLLPRSRFWTLTVPRAFSALFQAIDELWSEAATANDEVLLEHFPETTTDPKAQLLRRHGLSPAWIEHIDDARARAILLALDRQAGPMSPGRLQTTLQVCGFDLYVHEWWEPPGPPWTTRDPRPHIVAPLIGSTRCGMTSARCGVPSARCDAHLIRESNYIANQTLLPIKQPTIPDAEIGWRGLFYVGGPVWPDSALVDVADKRLLEWIILRLKRASQWAVLLVDFAALDTLLTNDGEPILTNDGEPIYA